MKTLRIKDTWLNVKKNFCNSLQCRFQATRQVPTHCLSSLSHHAGWGWVGVVPAPRPHMECVQLVKLDEEISKPLWLYNHSLETCHFQPLCDLVLKCSTLELYSTNTRAYQKFLRGRSHPSGQKTGEIRSKPNETFFFFFFFGLWRPPLC